MITITESRYYFEDPVDAITSLSRTGFFGPTVVALTRFQCALIVSVNTETHKGWFKTSEVVHRFFYIYTFLYLT